MCTLALTAVPYQHFRSKQDAAVLLSGHAGGAEIGAVVWTSRGLEGWKAALQTKQCFSQISGLIVRSFVKSQRSPQLKHRARAPGMMFQVCHATVLPHDD